VWLSTNYNFLQYQSDHSVDADNQASYVKKQLLKFGDGDLKVKKNDKFFCHFCPNKVKLGDRNSLEMHALALTYESKEIRDRANHKALAHFMFGAELPPYGQRSKEALLSICRVVYDV